MDILTPDDPRWVNFVLILTGPEWLDFRLIDPNDINIAGECIRAGYVVRDGIAWFCEESKRKPFAREVLAGMGNIDVEATLAQWPDLCDCDLVFKLGNDEEEE